MIVDCILFLINHYCKKCYRIYIFGLHAILPDNSFISILGRFSSTGDGLTDMSLCIPSCCINSLAPRRFEKNFREVIFKLIVVIDCLGISCEIVLT